MTLVDARAGHSAVTALPVPPGLFILSRPCTGSSLRCCCISFLQLIRLGALQTSRLLTATQQLKQSNSSTLSGLQMQEHCTSLAQEMCRLRQNNKTSCTQFLASISSALSNIPWEHAAALLDHHEYIYNKSWLVKLYWPEGDIFSGCLWQRSWPVFPCKFPSSCCGFVVFGARATIGSLCSSREIALF